MRPLKVEFQAFGPYAGREVVDFEAISNQGLFLICGKTGIGKTMILDAMTFALYGKSSGHGRDDFESMRCTKADFNTNTYVRFIFENNGEVYYFERRLVRKRTNLSPEYNLMRKNADGAWDVLLENAKEKVLNARAEEIIGLDYEQFRQVMILPQGQFEKLLISDSAEKEKILSKIFGEEKWKSIAEVFYQNADKRKKQVADKKAAIRTSLQEEGFNNVTELKTDIGSKQRQLEALEADQAKTDYDKVIEEQQNNLVIVNRFKDLHDAEKRVGELNGQKEERAGWSRRIKDAERAEAIRSLLAGFDNASQAYDARCKDLEAKKKDEEAKKAEDRNAADRLKEHSEKEPDIEKKKEQKAHYESIKPDYEGLSDAETHLKAKRKEAEAKAAEAKKASTVYDNATKKITALQGEYNVLQGEHKELLHQYLAGITGELASQLVDGMACPVCGSTEYPKKAFLAENSVNKETVEAKKNESDKKYGDLTEAIADQQKKKELLDGKSKEQESLNAEVAGLEAKVSEMKKKLVEGIDTITALNTGIKNLDKEIRDFADARVRYQEAAQKARDSYTEAKSLVSSAQKEVSSAKKDFEAAQLELKTGLEKLGFASEEEAKALMLDEDEKKALNSKIAKYDAELKKETDDLAKYRKELAKKEEPDKEKCEQAIQGAIDAKTEYAKKHETLQNEINRLTKKCTRLEADSSGLEQEEAQAEEDYIFAKKLRGDSGISLQRYVLGIMFSSVVAAGNRMLEMVHGGRYRLFRSDDKNQGNKTGLELKVYDKNSEDHEGRFVNTLSGGEKFLTSLALSIGLSTIAQKSGIKIEALFIDEGFGSLDEDSIVDAMNVLNSIQKANGMVGIISHVQILQERIPAKLKVEDTPDGRHIVQSIG